MTTPSIGEGESYATRVGDDVVFVERRAVTPRMLADANLDLMALVETRVRHELMRAGAEPATVRLVWICEGVAHPKRPATRAA